MLIKKRKLGQFKTSVKKDTNILQLSQSAQAIQHEINKAKQEAKHIKDEAEQVLTNAKKQLEDAQEKANQIINTAEEDALEIKKRIYEESKIAVGEEIAILREETKLLFADLFDIKRQALMEVHKDIINVALDLAEKIIRYQANIDPEILKTQVIEAIKKASSNSERIQVFVNPQDLAKLEENIEGIEKLFPAGITITALTNESIDLGSCTIETKSGQLDARFSTQLMTLTKLCEHLDVAEPIINIEDNNPLINETELNITPFEELIEEPTLEKNESVEIPLEPILDREKELLDEGFTSDEALMKELLDDDFDTFNTEDIQVPEELNTPEIIQDNFENTIDIAIDNNIETEPQDTELEYEEEIYEDDEENEENNLNTTGILKPKKKNNSAFNDLANEVEQNPEWKDLLSDNE